MTGPAAADKPDGEECAWCKFMKGGPCKAVFEVWQSCVDSVMEPDEAPDEQSRQAAVAKCAEVTAPLFSCLVKHPDYYGPQIDSMAAHSRAEQAGGDPATAATEARRPISSSDRSSTTNGSIAAAAAAASVVEPAGRANVRGG